MEMVIGTVFDLFRGTRMEEFGQDIVWGIVNSFHVTSQRIEKREDEATKKLGDMARAFDPSEIYAVELEETQRIAQTLMDCREAMEAMRDYAGEIYRVETGRPFSTVKGTRVSSGLTASQIDARDFLAARAAKRREDHAPTGPVVIFSGGTDWHDHELLWQALDETHARVPHMILATTAQHKGCDQIAHAWAAARRQDRPLHPQPGTGQARRLRPQRATDEPQAGPRHRLRRLGPPVQPLEPRA
jgi:hypothetical protein